MNAPADKNARLLAKARSLPDAPGVYLMKDDQGTEIYVGKARSLRRRVSSYFQKRERPPKEIALVQNIVDFDFARTDSEVEALLLESRLIKDLTPRYNAMLKNNEPYPFVEITWDEDFPRVLITRQKTSRKRRYFGPFVGSADVRVALTMLQRIFRFRTCARKIRAGDKKLRFERGCLNLHIGRCNGPCAGRISREDYRKRISSLCRFLRGQKRELVEDLRNDMARAARDLQFENAAALRDMIDALETIRSQPVDESLSSFVPETNPRPGLEALQHALGLAQLPCRIEGIDIANLQGKECVGSLVTFVDGMPFKDDYRRFRIRSVAGQDDFAAIAEVVARRYRRLRDEGREIPDIILVDGGKGQLSSAAASLRQLAVRPGALLGLAKEEETLFQHGRPDPVPMSQRNPGLKLLMHVRDEAHRFAQHYHHILRRKAVFGEEEQ